MVCLLILFGFIAIVGGLMALVFVIRGNGL
jgi:hypothetical protein